MALGRNVPKFHVIFLIIVCSFLGNVVASRYRKIYQKPINAGSWKTLTGGLHDSSVLLIGWSAAFISGCFAIMAAREEISNIVAFPLISIGGVIFYFGCAATMNFIFTKK
ncbi:uncharacterized protein LOC129976221 [Argiope bruennichi]|uniref:uncharacterized protein LOC129976221 n=1 Tax=Argiope bruennichi TaxID=94029 RepID=UPI0024947416|nr:uncharacterized protein LOC129976221 [Argiope bruennichi]